jgi:hypothetical protein
MKYFNMQVVLSVLKEFAFNSFGRSLILWGHGGGTNCRITRQLITMDEFMMFLIGYATYT